MYSYSLSNWDGRLSQESSPSRTDPDSNSSSRSTSLAGQHDASSVVPRPGSATGADAPTRENDASESLDTSRAHGKSEPNGVGRIGGTMAVTRHLEPDDGLAGSLAWQTPYTAAQALSPMRRGARLKVVTPATPNGYVERGSLNQPQPTKQPVFQRTVSRATAPVIGTPSNQAVPLADKLNGDRQNIHLRPGVENYSHKLIRQNDQDPSALVISSSSTPVDFPNGVPSRVQSNKLVESRAEMPILNTQSIIQKAAVQPLLNTASRSNTAHRSTMPNSRSSLARNTTQNTEKGIFSTHSLPSPQKLIPRLKVTVTSMSVPRVPPQTPPASFHSQPLLSPSHPKSSNQARRTPLQMVPSSAPSSPEVSFDQLLSGGTLDDTLTSADADGESVTDLDHILITSNNDAQMQQENPSHSSLTKFQSTSKAIPANSAPRPSVYDLSISSSHSTPSQLTVRRKQMWKPYVLVPPLPLGKKKVDYRPVKRIKRSHDGSLALTAHEDTARKKQRREVEREDKSVQKTTEKELHAFRSFFGQGRHSVSPQKLTDKSKLPLPIRASSESVHKEIIFKHQSGTPTNTRDVSIKPRSELSRSQTVVSTTSATSAHSKAVSGEESAGGELQVHRQFHEAPATVWFNTRFILRVDADPASWTLLGMGAKKGCVKRKLCAFPHIFDDNDGFAEYECGGPVEWVECLSENEKEEDIGIKRGSSNLRATPANLEGDMITPKKKNEASQPPFESPIVMPTIHPKRGRPHKPIQNSAVVPPRSTASGPPLHSSTTTLQESALHDHNQEPRLPLSEKALGKQKAVDPNASASPAPLSSPAKRDISLTPSFTVAAATPRPASPHDTFDKGVVESYIDLDAPSPDKSRDLGDPLEPSPLPVLVTGSSTYQQQPGRTFSWRTNTDDLFLSNPGPSVFGGFDALGQLDQFQDQFGGTSANGETTVRSESMTIDPALLVGGGPDELTVTDLEEMIDMGDAAEEYEILDLVRDRGSKSSGRSSSQRSANTSSSSSPSEACSSVIVGRTSSPVFSDYVPNGQQPKENITWSPSASPQPLPRAGTRLSRVRSDRGKNDAEHMDHSAARSDSDDASFSPRSKQTVRKLSEKRSPPAIPKPATVKIPVPRGPGKGVRWECGKEESFCHQCRRKTFRLKMTCPCKKKYCNRCLAIRYPSFPFRLRLNGFECPCCRNECNCDICSRKRGEDYVSLRVSLKEATDDGFVRAAQTAHTKPPGSQTPNVPRAVRFPSPEPITNVEGPFLSWGTVYDLDGRKIATAFVGSDGDAVVFANTVDGYERPPRAESAPSRSQSVKDDRPATRTFIGSCQSSWGLGKAPIIKELGRGGQRRGRSAKDKSEHARWFIGEEHLLYCPVVAYSRDLPAPNLFSDLSSLSSLSGDSDVDIEPRLPEGPVGLIIDATDNMKNAGASFSPNAVNDRDTIRALALALNTCGMTVKIDKSLVTSR